MRLDFCAYDSPLAVTGPASWFQRVPELIAREGFQIRVHLFWWEAEHSGTLHQYLEKRRIPFESHQFRSSCENVTRLLNSISKDPPGVFVADNVIPALLCTRYLKDWGIRTVGILRSDDEFYHGILDRFAGGRRCDQLDAIVSVSEYLTERARRAGAGRIRCETIPSGAPVPPIADRPKAKRRQIVYCGRLVQEQKRILETARCLVELVRRFPDLDAVIAGDGPELDAVRGIAAASGGRVKVLGRQTEQQIQQLLAESQMILLLSDYEGTPSAVMEAMAHGVVPICLNIRSGIPELVLDGQTGLLVTDRWDAVFAAVERLLRDAALASGLSAAARQRVIERFSISASATRWVTLLRELTVDAVVSVPEALPDRLELPKIHHGYRHQDLRDPEGLEALGKGLAAGFRKFRMEVGLWRRRICGMRDLDKGDNG